MSLHLPFTIETISQLAKIYAEHHFFFLAWLKAYRSEFLNEMSRNLFLSLLK